MSKLAIEGGRPVRSKPFPPRVIFDEREKRAALSVIEKTMKGPEAVDLYGRGPEVAAFTREFARFYGVKFAAVTSSGTTALHTAISALRLNPCSEIITSPITDPGTVAAILMANCIPVFADVDYDTLCITADTIEKRITKHTKAIIPVHLAGNPCDMGPIMKLARKHKFAVIEDAAQAHGAKYGGKCVGSIGDIGAFSLMGSKHSTSGGQGGMVITDNEKLYWNAKRFADRGKPFNSRSRTNLFLGMNYRMTELQAAIGRVQLRKLPAMMRKRRRFFSKLERAMKEAGLKAVGLSKVTPGAEPNPWFWFLHYEAKMTKVSKGRFAEALKAEGLPVRADYVVPIYKQRWIREKNTYGDSHYPWSTAKGRKYDYEGSCPDAERALADHMTLFLHEGFGDPEITDIVTAIKKVEVHYVK